MASVFDIGGIIGGIIAGVLSDYLQRRAVVSCGFMALSVPAMLVYRAVVTSSEVSLYTNGSLMFIVGVLVNGTYALITTAVSADLGSHESLRGNAEAMGMVTAIIDGTGSLGACVTGVAISALQGAVGWDGTPQQTFHPSEPSQYTRSC